MVSCELRNVVLFVSAPLVLPLTLSNLKRGSQLHMDSKLLMTRPVILATSTVH
jgi:hypothetical protein